MMLSAYGVAHVRIVVSRAPPTSPLKYFTNPSSKFSHSRAILNPIASAHVVDANRARGFASASGSTST